MVEFPSRTATWLELPIEITGQTDYIAVEAIQNLIALGSDDDNAKSSPGQTLPDAVQDPGSTVYCSFAANRAAS